MLINAYFGKKIKASPFFVFDGKNKVIKVYIDHPNERRSNYSFLSMFLSSYQAVLRFCQDEEIKMKVKFNRFSSRACMPNRATAESAGYCSLSAENVKLEPNST